MHQRHVISLLIHAFLSVNARLLIAFGTVFYAIMSFTCTALLVDAVSFFELLYFWYCCIFCRALLHIWKILYSLSTSTAFSVDAVINRNSVQLLVDALSFIELYSNFSRSMFYLLRGLLHFWPMLHLLSSSAAHLVDVFFLLPSSIALLVYAVYHSGHSTLT